MSGDAFAAEIMRTVEQRVTMLRRPRELTREQFAAKIKIGTRNLQRIERGRQKLTFGTFIPLPPCWVSKQVS